MNTNQSTYAVRGLKHILAPVILLLLAAALIYGSMVISLPEKLLPYETLFYNFSTIATLFFLAVTLPCVIGGAYMAVMAMIRDRKWILPILTLVLDAGVMYGWIYAVRYFF